VLSVQLHLLGVDVRQDALLNVLTDDAARSSRIEGKDLNELEVKSSIDMAGRDVPGSRPED